MSNIQLKVLPAFPAQVSGVAPIVVTKSGLTYTIGYSAALGQLSVVQIKQQLVAITQFDTILATIPGDPKSAVKQIWDGNGFTQLTGPLLTSIYATLGYSPAQQATFNAAAALFSY
jgi:hypothetical protein